MKSITLKDVQIIQHYICCGILIHPLLYTLFLEKLKVMQSGNKLCLLPVTSLQICSQQMPKGKPTK